MGAKLSVHDLSARDRDRSARVLSEMRSRCVDGSGPFDAGRAAPIRGRSAAAPLATRTGPTKVGSKFDNITWQNHNFPALLQGRGDVVDLARRGTTVEEGRGGGREDAGANERVFVS